MNVFIPSVVNWTFQEVFLWFKMASRHHLSVEEIECKMILYSDSQSYLTDNETVPSSDNNAGNEGLDDKDRQPVLRLT
jgi:hypothetical protein